MPPVSGTGCQGMLIWEAMVIRTTPAATRARSSPIAAVRSEGRGMMLSRRVPSAAWRVVEIGGSLGRGVAGRGTLQAVHDAAVRAGKGSRRRDTRPAWDAARLRGS